MIKKIYFIVVTIIIASAVELAAKCTKFSIPNVAIMPPSVEEVVTLIKSQELSPEMLKQIAATKEQNLADIQKYKNSSVAKYKHSSIEELVEKDGFKLESHEVTTEDGYILTIHRILGDCNGNGKVVFLNHAFALSSIDFITAGKENSIAYFLVSKGFDVWMGNARGTRYGRKNKHISPKCAEFWDFSFHEVGVYDLPAMIDYVLEKTGQKKLNYIGFAQGSNVAFVLCSERPEYNEKFEKIISLTTLSYISHVKSPVLRALIERPDLLDIVTHIFGLYEIPSDGSSPLAALFYHALEDVICGNNEIGKILCSNLVFFTFGYDRDNLNVENLPVIVGHIPGGFSSKLLAHYGQLLITGKYRQFDYDEKKNLEVYNQKTPPYYNLSNVKAPNYIFYSDSDTIVTLPDTEIVLSLLPNVVDSYLIPNYNFLDFIYSRNLKTDIHPILAKILEC